MVVMDTWVLWKKSIAKVNVREIGFKVWEAIKNKMFIIFTKPIFLALPKLNSILLFSLFEYSNSCYLNKIFKHIEILYTLKHYFN